MPDDITLPNSAPPAWFTGLDADIVGHLQTKGWDKLDPKDAVAQAVKAHREVEKMIGVPANLVARLPADANDKDAWTTLNTRLGVPADKAAYDFTGVDEGLAAQMRDAVHAAGLRPEQASAVASAVAKHLSSTAATDAATKKSAVDADILKLRNEWGGQFETNDAIVGRAMAHLDAPQEALDAMKNSIGAYKTMDFFLKLGRAMGEARFIEGEKPAGANGIMSAEQATARLADIKNDPQWLDRWAKSGRAERDEFNALHRVIAEARMNQR